MEQYISKSALVAEIKRREEKCNTFYDIALRNNAVFAKVAIEEQKRQYNSLLSFLDTLEVKELLTWQDIRLISEIGEDFMNSEESDNLNEEEYYQSILNKFKTQKGE